MSQPFSKAAAEASTSESDQMDFDNEDAEGIAYLDVSPHLFHKVDFSSLARYSRNWLPRFATITLKIADNGGDKDLGINYDWIAFQTRSSHGAWQQSLSNYLEKSASPFKPKTWSAPIDSSILFFDWRSIASLPDAAPWQTYQDLLSNSGGS